MSMALFDSIARIARHEVDARATIGIGKVVDVHTASGSGNDHAVSIEMRDSKLLLSRVPVSVGLLGSVSIPKPGDLVVVAFSEGDYNAPVVVGQLYHSGKKPPPHDENKFVLALPDESADDPQMKVEISRTSNARLTLTVKDDITIDIVPDTISLKLGDIKLELTSGGGGRAEVSAGGSKMVIKKDGEISIKAETKLKLEASEIEINGQASVKISGATIDLNK